MHTLLIIASLALLATATPLVAADVTVDQDIPPGSNPQCDGTIGYSKGPVDVWYGSGDDSLGQCHFHLFIDT